MTFFLPRLKAFCGAEIVSHTMHNLYTLRGAKVRDAAKWAGYIDEAIDLFGADTEVVFNSHHWPVWGNAQVLDYLKKQRDTYAVHPRPDAASRVCGLTPRQIAETIRLPKSLEQHVRRSRLLRHAEAQREGGVSVLLRLVRRQSGEPRSAAAGGTRQTLRRRDRRPCESVGGRADGVRRRRLSLGRNAARQPGVRATATTAAAKELLARIVRPARLSRRVGSVARLLSHRRAGAAARRRCGEPGLGGLLASVPIESIFAAMATQIDGAAADGKAHHGERDVHRSETLVRARTRELGAAPQGNAAGAKAPTSRCG